MVAVSVVAALPMVVTLPMVVALLVLIALFMLVATVLACRLFLFFLLLGAVKSGYAILIQQVDTLRLLLVTVFE